MLIIVFGAFIFGIDTAVYAIIILVVRFLILNKKDEYIAFGPFLSMSAIICIFLTPGAIYDVFFEIIYIVTCYIDNKKISVAGATEI